MQICLAKELIIAGEPYHVRSSSTPISSVLTSGFRKQTARSCWFRAKPQQVPISALVENIKGFSPSHNITTQRLSLTTRLCVGHENLIRKRGYDGIAFDGGSLVCPARVIRKRREQKQATV